jgi:S-adenosylmethionine hydrolase
LSRSCPGEWSNSDGIQRRQERLGTAKHGTLERAGTFSDRSPDTAFWYENSNGPAEIAVNQGRADRELGLAIGIPVEIVS